VGVKHKRIMTNKTKTTEKFLIEWFDKENLEWFNELGEENRLDFPKGINLSVLRDLCVVAVNQVMVIQEIDYKVDYSTYEEIMDYYENELVEDESITPFIRKVIELCVEGLLPKKWIVPTNKEKRETFINQLVRATFKTYFDKTIDEIEMIYQYGEEYFERYREELPTKNKKVVGG
jgi:hypothetical protein